MKKRIDIIPKVVILLLPMLFIGCNTDIVSSNKSYFTIDSSDRKIMFPVRINDSIKANMFFDTGTVLGCISFDSTFCANHPFYLWEGNPDTMLLGTSSAWTYQAQLWPIFNKSLTINICKENLKYDWFMIKDRKKHSPNNKEDGLFNIPVHDTSRVWELNFEQNYLEIHQANDFAFPKDCHFLPFVAGPRDSSLYVQMPLKIKSVDGDTLTMNHAFLIDTGMPWDIALVSPAKELSFFEKKDAVWTGYINSYYRRYVVNAELFECYTIDSLRIYTFDEPYLLGTQYLIGLNFLKRFNVFFDMHNRQLGLQPIKNFKRIVNPNHRRFHLSFREDSSGKRIVNKVADYKGNRYKEAGIQEGDQILSVNDSAQVKVFNIIRNGKPLQITVIDDPNEEQGD